MKELTWDLFQKTGDIKYYLLYKKLIEEEDKCEDRKCRRYNTYRY